MRWSARRRRTASAPSAEGFGILPAQASAGGDSLAYLSQAALPGASGNELQRLRRLPRRRRLAEHCCHPADPRPDAAQPRSFLDYGFSADLSQVVTQMPNQQLAAANLPPEKATPGVFNLFLRHPDGSYSLVTAAAPRSPPPPTCGDCASEDDLQVFAGANGGEGDVPAFSHVLFEANESLVTTPQVNSAPGVENLYESDMEEAAATRVHPVGVLPDGTLPASGSAPGAGISVYANRPHRRLDNPRDRTRDLRRRLPRRLRGRPPTAANPTKPRKRITEVYDRVNGKRNDRALRSRSRRHPGQPRSRARPVLGRLHRRRRGLLHLQGRAHHRLQHRPRQPGQRPLPLRHHHQKTHRPQPRPRRRRRRSPRGHRRLRRRLLRLLRRQGRAARIGPRTPKAKKPPPAGPTSTSPTTAPPASSPPSAKKPTNATGPPLRRQLDGPTSPPTAATSPSSRSTSLDRL